LSERVNFAAGEVGDIDKPGIQKLIGRLRAMGELSPSAFVDACLDLAGPIEVADATHSALISFAEKGGALKLTPGDRAAEQRVGELLQLIVATREYQLV